MVSVIALRRDEFTLKDGERVIQDVSDESDAEDVGAEHDYERNTCKSTANN